MEDLATKMKMPGSKVSHNGDGMPGVSNGLTNTIMPGAQMTNMESNEIISMPSAEMAGMSNKLMKSSPEKALQLPSPNTMQGPIASNAVVSKQKVPLSKLGDKQKASTTEGSVIVPVHGGVREAPAAPTQLTYGNGPLLTNVQIVTVFWGAAWTQAPQNTLLTQINQFFDFVLTSPLIDLLGQYSAPGKTIGHGSRIGTFTDTSQTGNGTHVTDAQVQQKVQALISNGSVHAANANTLYFVYLPPNVSLSGPTNAGGGNSCVDFCGYHWYISGTNPEVYYAAMPFPSCNGCLGGLSQIQSLTSVSSHELCEAITDPHPWSGWNSSQGEIGDICAWQTGVLGGYTVQKEWSNKDGACLIVNTPNPWSGWASLGGWIDRLAVSNNLDGRLEAFVRGSNGAVFHNWQVTPNGNWSGWATLGGWVDMLTVAKNKDGRMEVFARGSDGAVWHNWQTVPNGNWSGWASLGGWVDRLAVGHNADGRLEVFARGGDGALWHIWQIVPNGSWSGWSSLGGWIDMLTVGNNQDGRLEVFARGGDKAVWHIWQVVPNGNWSGWASLGGWIDLLTVGKNKDGRLEVFARGSDKALWHNWQTVPNGNWSGWASLGGWIDLLTVGNNQDGRMEVFVRGSDGAVYHNWQTAPNNGWSGWGSLGGWIDLLEVGNNQDGRLEVFARGGDAAMYHNWQTAPNF
jgi:acylphosphatase